jgi:hypothetical protein
MKNKMKKLVLILIASLTPVASYASVRWFNSSGEQLGILSDAKCSSGVDCEVSGGKLVMSVPGDGMVQTQVAATATTLTSAQCGSTFYNTGAVEVRIPKASGVLGCRYTFVTLNASKFDVNPIAFD